MTKINEDILVGNTGIKLNNLIGTILWSNPNAGSSFSSQDIAVSNISSYEFIEIVYWTEVSVINWSYLETSGPLPIIYNHYYQLGMYIQPCNYVGEPQYFGRTFTINTNNKISFQNGYNYNSTNGWNQRNLSGVPLYIIGYKKRNI